MNELRYNKTPRLSVIVPVYKAEKYLRRCVDSILAQSFLDFELLLIDDGSPDESGKICEEYAEHDSRIKVIHKKNGGVGSARNVGLDNCVGSYVTFIDSDDEILPGFFELAQKYSEDVISGKMLIYKDDGQEDVRTECVPDQPIIIGKENIFAAVIHSKTTRFSGPFTMLWRREVIGNNRFNEKMVLGEDSLFSLQCICNAKSLRIVQDIVYRYYAPAGYSAKYAMSIDCASYHIAQFFETADKIPYIDPSYCRDRLNFYLWACNKDTIYHPVTFVRNKTIMFYYKKYRKILSRDVRFWAYRYIKYFIVGPIRNRKQNRAR